MKISIVVLILSICSIAFADKPSVVISSDATSIFQNESFQFTVSFNNFDGEISMSETKGLEKFNVIGGPYQSSSNRWESINGETKSVTSIVLTYSLRPKFGGSIKLGPFKAKSGDKEYSSNTITIRVYKQGDSIPADKQKNQAYIRTVVSNKNPYPGETIRVDYFLYITPDMDIRAPKLVDSPKMKGFIKKDIKLSDNRELVQKIYGGIKYRTLHVLSYYLTPTASGKYNVESLVLDVPFKEKKRRRRRSFDPFMDDDIFSGFRSYKEKRLSSDPVTVNVKSFPSEGKPSGFNGLSGNFSIKSSFDKDSVKVNEAITIKFKVRGKGNFNDLQSLGINFPNDFEIYDPVRKESLSGDNRGWVEFEYVVIPRFPGDYEISPEKIFFFNPKSKKYQTAETQKISLKVYGKANNSMVIPNNITRKEIKVLGKDIRYIKKGKGIEKNNISIQNYLLLSLGIIFLPFFSYLFALKSGKIDKNSLKRAKAYKSFMKIYRKSKQEIESNNIKEFYSLTELAVFTYFADKLNKSTSGIIPDEIYFMLSESSVSDDVIASLKDILDRCSLNKFITSSIDEAKSDFRNLPLLLEKIEEVL
ncbi:MAG: hypothetical protein CR982_09440 [Candidatus Cloacimonadota bacterium]|nr:MAG: hypothetical protein CR982_09440 [Candidatus Cloacimonadota bacterium]PIE79263.1 MAG: hypothetical protein CSA15_03615 [Candidatus Delongbacteria bacterium]